MLNKLSQFLDFIVDQLISIGHWILDGFVFIIGKIFYFIFDVLLSVIEQLIHAVDFVQFQTLHAFSNWNLLPPQILYVLYKLHFAQILTVIAAAYMIRKLLDLIPAAFTRV